MAVAPPEATPTPTPTPAEVKAVIGLGFHTSQVYPDYSLSNNVLSSTHLGKVSPQYMLGVAYALPFNYSKNQKVGEDNADCQADPGFRCRPVSVFVSAKFSATASDTVNGVSFGIAHKLSSLFSVLFATSLDPYQQPSPSFMRAAVQTVKAQQALGNPYYTQFDPAAMQANKQDAFDGFSTLFVTTSTSASTGAVTLTQNNPISPGNALITNYHFGFLFGVALTPDFKSLLGIKP